MRLVTYASDQGPRAGLLRDEWVVDVQRASDAAGISCPLPSDLRALLALGERAWDGLHRLAKETAWPEAVRRDAVRTRLLAPLPRPGKIVAVARNFRDWLAQAKQPVPSEPTLFAKLPNTVVGPEDLLQLPALSSQVTYEAEVAVVIGRPGKDIPPASAMEHVAGYTIINDLTAIDIIKKDGNFFRGKNFDTFAPLGPFLASPDEVADPHALRIRLVKGKRVLQDSSTEQMVMRIPELISYISRGCTLDPGDIIATGSPGGTAPFHDPPAYLAPGDELEIHITGLGILRNRVA